MDSMSKIRVGNFIFLIFSEYFGSRGRRSQNKWWWLQRLFLRFFFIKVNLKFLCIPIRGALGTTHIHFIKIHNVYKCMCILNPEKYEVYVYYTLIHKLYFVLCILLNFSKVYCNYAQNFITINDFFVSYLKNFGPVFEINPTIRILTFETQKCEL